MFDLEKIKPRTITGQLVTAIILAMLVLQFCNVAIDVLEELEEERTVDDRIIVQLGKVMEMLEKLEPGDYRALFDASDLNFLVYAHSKEAIAEKTGGQELIDYETAIERMLGVKKDDVIVSKTYELDPAFDYVSDEYGDHSDILKTIISIRLGDNSWFNTALNVHNHGFSYYKLFWWSITLVLLLIVVSVFVLLRITRPLEHFTNAIGNFSDSFEVSLIPEEGPLDVRLAIRSFNRMQKNVADHIKKRTKTLAAISHDLRSPLTALRLKAEMLTTNEEKESIISSIDKMERITASAIDYLKGTAKLDQKRPVDLGVLVDVETNELKELGLPVITSELPSIVVNCDPDAVARALNNLIENAIKYGDMARISLTSQDGFACIIVEDEGPGVPENEIPNLMEPFERLGSDRNSDKGGFGLGLSIASDIAKWHDGELVLKNMKDKGLRAELTLALR